MFLHRPDNPYIYPQSQLIPHAQAKLQTEQSRPHGQFDLTQHVEDVKSVMPTSTPVERFSVPVVNKTVLPDGMAQNQVTVNALSKKYKCPHCPAAYWWSNQLQAHSKTHRTGHVIQDQISRMPSRLSRDQIEYLETFFQQQHKPTTESKMAIAGLLNVTLEKVNNWFQNRRCKAKKDKSRGFDPYVRDFSGSDAPVLHSRELRSLLPAIRRTSSSSSTAPTITADMPDILVKGKPANRTEQMTPAENLRIVDGTMVRPPVQCHERLPPISDLINEIDGPKPAHGLYETHLKTA